MTMTMTRKEFLFTAAGAAASVNLAASYATSAAPKSKMKLGATLYSYTPDMRSGFMTMEDCIADISDMGAEGVEILGMESVPGYPNPSESWVKKWYGWMEKYNTKPSAYYSFSDTKFHKDRLMTIDESVEYMVRDIKLANRLGFKAMTQQWPAYPPDDPADLIWAPYHWSTPAMQVIEKALPSAEKYDVRIAMELHSPSQYRSAFIERTLEFITRTKTKYFGYNPDFSSFTKRPPRARVAALVNQGGRQKILDYIIQAYQNRVGPDKTVAEVKKMGGNEVELNFAGIGGIYHSSNNDPKDLARLVPYVYHVHAKFYEMTDDLTEYCIPYEELIPILAEGGYDRYLSSEYEGSREELPTSGCIRMQHAMMRKLLGA